MRPLDFDLVGRAMAIDNVLELRAWANNDSDPERATMMRLAADEIERLRFRAKRDAELRDVSHRNWIEAAETALLGDLGPLDLRVRLSKAGPIDFVEQSN
jgi:hypothetical protein